MAGRSVLERYEYLRHKHVQDPYKYRLVSKEKAQWLQQLRHSHPQQTNRSLYNRRLERVDADNTVIRILWLSPGPSSRSTVYHERGVVRGRLITTLLKNAPLFQALSYSWGPQDDLVEIDIQSTLGRFQYPFLVSRHLEHCLRNLRHPEHEVAVWVDAICINQADHEERNEQVAIMAEIYRAASQVVIYLGLPKRIIPVVRRLQESHIHDVEAVVAGRPGIDRCEACPMCDRVADLQVLATDSRGDAEILFLQPHDAMTLAAAGPLAWWNRLWCLQELLLSKTPPKVMLGSYTFQWDHFVQIMASWGPKAGCTLCLRRGDEYRALLSECERFRTMETRRTRYQDAIARGTDSAFAAVHGRHATSQDVNHEAIIAEIFSFLELLSWTASLNASMAYDRIYAILGLLSPAIRASICVSYEIPVNELFKSVTLSLLSLSDLYLRAIVLQRLLLRPAAGVVPRTSPGAYLELCDDDPHDPHQIQWLNEYFKSDYKTYREFLISQDWYKARKELEVEETFTLKALASEEDWRCLMALKAKASAEKLARRCASQVPDWYFTPAREDESFMAWHAEIVKWIHNVPVGQYTNTVDNDYDDLEDQNSVDDLNPGFISWVRDLDASECTDLNRFQGLWHIRHDPVPSSRFVHFLAEPQEVSRSHSTVLESDNVLSWPGLLIGTVIHTRRVTDLFVDIRVGPKMYLPEAVKYSQKHRQIMFEIGKWLHERKFEKIDELVLFITQEDHVGICVSAELKAGDMVAYLEAFSSACILRPLRQVAGAYRVEVDLLDDERPDAFHLMSLCMIETGSCKCADLPHRSIGLELIKIV